MNNLFNQMLKKTAIRSVVTASRSEAAELANDLIVVERKLQIIQTFLIKNVGSEKDKEAEGLILTLDENIKAVGGIIDSLTH